MANPPEMRAAGAPLALSILVGFGIGAAFNQPSIGFLAGTAVGAAIAVAVWLGNRRAR